MSVLKVPVSSNDHILGDENAPVTMVEYGDFECPYCGAVHPIVKQLLEYFAGDVRFVYRHFPLATIHPNAEMAAEASEAAGAQGKFWEMHDWLFESQEDLSLESITSGAIQLELAVGEFLNALASHVHLPKVREDFKSGVRSGVNGTPTFFINGVRHDAAYDFETLAAAISARRQQVA